MAEDYHLGLSRLWYRAKGFREGLTVTGDFRSCTLEKQLGLVFTEESDGLYYLDFTFEELGTCCLLIRENGVKTISQNFRVLPPPDSNGFISNGSRGNLIGS